MVHSTYHQVSSNSKYIIIISSKFFRIFLNIDFVNQFRCYICYEGCQTCFGSSSSECSSCLVGSYLVGTACSPCPPRCDNCQDSSNCTVCPEGYLIQEHALGNFCIDMCGN